MHLPCQEPIRTLLLKVVPPTWALRTPASGGGARATTPKPGSEGDFAACQSQSDGLGARRRAELSARALRVGADRLARQAELLGDRRAVATLGQQRQDLALAV